MREVAARVLVALPFLMAAAACGQGPAAPAAEPAVSPPARFASTTSRSYLGLGINTPGADATGKPARAPCLTCHAVRPASDANARSNALTKFHQGVRLQHGNLVCLTCHRAEGRDTLGLADGRALDYASLKSLCGQCHARRLEEYERGAHGGMSGYWDLSRGPRTRNLCTDCHDPHAPRIPQVVPAPQPSVTH
ncbi:MAG: hypothetical protein QM765_29720 [Myxococcales bacterium]